MANIIVSSGQTLTGQTALAGSTVTVEYGGGTDAETLLDGSSEAVEAGGVANSTTIGTAGSSAGSAGPAEFAVSNEGVAAGTSILAGGLEVIVGGSDSNVSVSSGGSLDVSLYQSSALQAERLGSVTAPTGDAVTLTGSTAKVYNEGVIASSAGNGVNLEAGGVLSNVGTISGANDGIIGGQGAASISLTGGTVTGGNHAIEFVASSATAPVIDVQGGMFVASGSGAAILFADGGVVTNDGTIDDIAPGDTAIQGVSDLILGAGSSIVGSVVSATGGTLSLSGLGTLSGIGTLYSDFSEIQVAPDESVTLAGSNHLASYETFTVATGSTLTVAAGSLSGDAGSTIAMGGLSTVPGATTLAVNSGLGSVAISGFDSQSKAIILDNVAYSPDDTVTVVSTSVSVSSPLGAGDTLNFSNAPSETYRLQSVAGGATEILANTEVGSVTSTLSGNGGVGSTISITLDVPNNVTVTTSGGSPFLHLSNGTTAAYVSDVPLGTAGSALTFETTVSAGQDTTDLEVTGVALNGAVIDDSQGNAVDTSLVPTLAGSNTGIAIVTAAPIVPAPPAPSGLTLAAASDTGVVGDDITSVVAPTITGTAEAGATVDLYDGTRVVGTTTAGGTGLFSVSGILVAGTNTLTATATDAAGGVSAASSSLVVTLDGTAPTIAGLTAVPSTSGVLGAGASISFTLTPSVAVSVSLGSGSPTLLLGDGGVAAYDASASTATSLVFQTVVTTGQSSADLQVIELNLGGAVIQDVAGNSLDGSGVPTLSGSTTGLAIDASPAEIIALAGVTTAPGANGGTVFTTAVGGSNTVTATATGNDVVNSYGTDTVFAGGGSDLVYALGSAATINGGSGALTFAAGPGNYTAGGGQGADLLYGGSGTDVLTGGAGANNIIVSGDGNTSLVGGAGSSALMFGGGVAGVTNITDVFTGSTGGFDTMVGGNAAAIFNMANGDVAFGGPSGTDTFNTGSGTSLIVEGTGATSVVLGTGATTDFGGTGADTYIMAKGIDAIADIIGFKAGDHLDLTGGFTQADASGAVANAATGSFGTTLHLVDGTTLNLFGVSVSSSQVSVV